MSSSDDEINDAIKAALNKSFQDFERSPATSVDKHIYAQLRKKPNRHPWWIAFGVFLLIVTGTVVLRDTENERSIGKMKTIGTVSTKNLQIQKDNKSNKNKTTSSKVASTSGIGTKALLLPDHINDSEKTPWINVHKQIQSPPSQNILADSLKLKTTNSITDTEKSIQQIEYKHLAIHTNPIPVDIRLPEITVQDNISTIAVEDTFPEKTGRKWSPSMIINFAAANTSQNVYLLPSTDSRILKVSFPNSMGNIGYKVGVGGLMNGYLVQLNYSHFQYQTEYLYATDEFTAEASDSRYHIRRSGISHITKSNFDFLGISIKKNFDFRTKSLGNLYAHFGFEYSRSLTGYNQQLLSTKLSIGKRILTGKKVMVMAGPFFEYNILRILPTEHNVKIRPNQTGVNIGIKFPNKLN